MAASSKRGSKASGPMLAIRLPAALREEIAEDAARLGVDVSVWMREAARAKLDAGMAAEVVAIRELLEQAKRRGVALDSLRLAIDVEMGEV
jgi:hypothetical protein